MKVKLLKKIRRRYIIYYCPGGYNDYYSAPCLILTERGTTDTVMSRHEVFNLSSKDEVELFKKRLMDTIVRWTRVDYPRLGSYIKTRVTGKKQIWP